MWQLDLHGAWCLPLPGLPSAWQVLDAGVSVASHQLEYSVLDRRPELFMTELCRKRGIPLIAYGTLVSATNMGYFS